MRTLSMLGSRVSTPRYGTLNSHRDFQVSLVGESRTLDRSQSSPGTFDRAVHSDRPRNGSSFERSAVLDNSRLRNFSRTLDGEDRKSPVVSPVSFQTFYTQQQQQQQQQPAVRNGGTRDMYSPAINNPSYLGYLDMNRRGTELTCLCHLLELLQLM